MHYKGCCNKGVRKVPNYDVKCNKCGKEFTSFAHIKDRYDIKCVCGGDTNILIKPQQHVAIHIWTPYWEENITHQPVLVESKQHLKDLCKEHNLIARRLD